MSSTIAKGLRILVALLVIAAVVATWAEAASRTTVNPFNLLGYFTIQANIVLAAAYLVSSLAGGRLGPTADTLLRAAATTYIVIVGLVYVTLLAPLGAAGGVPVPWANTALHIVTPLYALVDWLVFRDRVALPFNRLWWVLVYPVVWLVVVLVRGATDGWVPYPFLDPAAGYARVLGYVVAITVVFMVFGSLVFWLSRLGSRREVAA